MRFCQLRLDGQHTRAVEFSSFTKQTPWAGELPTLVQCALDNTRLNHQHNNRYPLLRRAEPPPPIIYSLVHNCVDVF